MQHRFCYAVRFDGDWSPSLAVWATDSQSALRIAAQTDMGRPTGAVEMFTPAVWEYTFGGLPGWENIERLPVLYGPGDGFYHRYRGKLYKMSATGTFQNP